MNLPSPVPLGNPGSVVQIAPGSVVQIDPGHDLTFGGCFMIIEEVKSWGFTGYVQPLRPGALAYYRVPFEACSYVGEAQWLATNS